MDEQIHEECGVAAVVLKKSLEYYPKGGAAYINFLMLNEQQNRGQQTSGMYVFNSERKKTLEGKKSVGLVNNLFAIHNPLKFVQYLEELEGTAAIGHVQYATSGRRGEEKDWLDAAQPFYFRHGNPEKRFVLAWNGNLANHEELGKQLEKTSGIVPETEVDTELLLYCIAQEVEKSEGSPDFASIFESLQKQCDGGYSIVLMNGLGHVYAFRGPPGIMPLCYGENESLFAIASESSALTKLGIQDVKFVQPGEALVYKDNVLERKFVKEHAPLKQCFFQHMYFAKVTSILDNVSVYTFRSKIGEELAKTEQLKKTDDLVIVPVPSTSIPIARRMAETLQVPYVEALIKSTNATRTFIEKEAKRDIMLDMKLSVIPRSIEGKRVILVDDSIVRGSTAKKMVQFVKERGMAKEVHVRSACPPVRFPCYYGIDFPTLHELAAAGVKDTDRLEIILAKQFGADSVRYLTYESMLGVYGELGVGKNQLCTACLNSEYPTTAGKERFKEALQRELVLLAQREDK